MQASMQLPFPTSPPQSSSVRAPCPPCQLPTPAAQSRSPWLCQSTFVEEFELRPLSPSLSLFPNVSRRQSVIPFSCRMARALYLPFSLAHPSSLTHLTAIASCVPASAPKTLSLQLNAVLHPLCSSHSLSQPSTVRRPLHTRPTVTLSNNRLRTLPSLSSGRPKRPTRLLAAFNAVEHITCIFRCRGCLPYSFPSRGVTDLTFTSKNDP